MNEIPLGHWRVQAGLRLREALFINGILFNSEAWQGDIEEDIVNLEKIDQALLRGILGAHAKIPTEALFLETGTIPLRFIMKSRRLAYLKTILNREPDELIREVYNAQKEDPIPGDFVYLVKKDANEINIDIQDEKRIEEMNSGCYKAIVKNKIREASLNYLEDIKSKHSKLENLKYDKLEISQYMRSPLFDFKSVQMLLALRTRTVRGVKNDFKGMYTDVMCPLGCTHEDTIPNILICPAIQSNIETNDMANGIVTYEDIFSADIIKQKQVTAFYMKCLEIRENILNSKPAANKLVPCINIAKVC